MAALRITRVQAVNAKPVALRITNVVASVTVPVVGVRALRITNVQALVSTPVTSVAAWRITNLEAGINTVVMDAGPNRFDIEPWSTVVLNGSKTPVGVWSQTTGTNVDLIVNGPDAIYIAPAAIGRTTLQFTYQYGSVSDIVTHVILPVTEKAAINGAWVPLRIQPIQS
jgi:hypothetical protein